MNVRPLTGYALVEILPSDTQSAGGIAFPDRHLSPEEVQARHRDPMRLKPPPLQGIVRAIGAWPKLRNGMALMPEFGIGARVIIGPLAGLQMVRGVGERFRMVALEEVLAVVS
jgi:co-chaperonin GroES (HSP10)